VVALILLEMLLDDAAPAITRARASAKETP
jgi:hypothetical protein